MHLCRSNHMDKNLKFITYNLYSFIKTIDAAPAYTHKLDKRFIKKRTIVIITGVLTKKVIMIGKKKAFLFENDVW